MNSVELAQYLEDLTLADRLAVQGETLHTQYSERVVLHHAEKAGPSPSLRAGWSKGI